ncbi:MAG: asparaginyl-tRNA synthetase [Trebouxia sp. A1-2]|nr:MAG: asparaginyl-tRNA synthetase [Trebouxia sp. A1-2]
MWSRLRRATDHLKAGQIPDGGPDKGVSNIGLKFDVRGWVNDGSTLTGLQVLVDPDTAGYLLVDSNTINTGAAVRVQGELVESPARGQLVELKATAVYLIGECNQETYPLQKKRHSLPYLRSIPHLRPRTNTFGAVTRVRSALAFATHQFFRESGFQYIHTPILSASDCEGAGEMFQVTTLIGKHDEALAQGPVSEQDVHHLKERISKQNSLVSSAKLAAHTVDSQDLRDQEKQAVQQLKHLKQQVGPLMERVTHYRGLVKNQEGLTDYSQDFFGKPTFLTVSGQLNAEMYATAMSDVYTFEFWMIEPEMAFADLSDDMNCAEAYLKHCLRYILDHCSEDLEFFARQNDKMLVHRLQDIVAKPFARLSYTDAVELLQKAKVKFTFPVNWGSDLQSEHERYLTETEFKGTPRYHRLPKRHQAFYMRVNSDDKTVAAMDLLVPGVGELIGGSQREERLQMLEQRIAQLGLNAQDYWWYLDLRRYGSVPHAGFGLGFERLVQFATGVENIRDVIPFPRYPGHCEF